MKSIVKELFIDAFLYFVMCMATFLMLRTIVGYGSFDTSYAFLAKKQAYLQNKVWLTAFYLHVFTSICTLIAGFTQFSTSILSRLRRLHRLMGKFYVISILVINVPAGFIMAIYANGLLPSKTAFLVLDILWFYFTFKGWRTAVQGKFNQHRDWMIRSFALTFSAITLRTWRLILEPVIPDPLTLYMVDAWMGFVPNLLFAEWLIRRKRQRALPVKIKHEQV